MRSVLISLDFIYREDGSLTPLELNTETKDDIDIWNITNDNFIEKTSSFFRHEELNQYLQSNNITKIVVIAGNANSKYIKAFADFYNYGYTLVSVGKNQVTVPEVEDSDDTIIIRIAYDTYALIDDLYARDNYEFHNLIKNESFASPVTFTENNFDTILNFEDSQDGTIPNYVLKARTPGYVKSEYPKIYKFDNASQLENLKSNLKNNEFIQKFEYNENLSLIDQRTHHLRSMNLICGENLDVVNLINYKSSNLVSIDNTKLIKDYEIDENNRLHPLNECKYYPTYLSKYGFRYHLDNEDKVLMWDNSLKPIQDVNIGDIFKGVKFPQGHEIFPNDPEYVNLNDIENFTLEETKVVSIQGGQQGIFTNITASNEEYGTLSWFDGISNLYLVSGGDVPNGFAFYQKGGELEIGQRIYVYNKSLNTMIDFIVEDLYFDLKDLTGYILSLYKTPEFLIQLEQNHDLYLVQHNSCNSYGCYYPRYPGRCTGTCDDCGKTSPFCNNCGGDAPVYCL